MSTIIEPSVLTANCYFWTPSQNASGRRSSERKNLSKVAEYFEALGLETTQSGDSVTGKGKGVEALFTYGESCKNVYKSLSVSRNGAKSNITALRKIAKEMQAV